ncbi:hypothetical protein BJ878DRAFT_508884 [Calycina marina]|uniref:Uncharacterized protein n=1 Tax=Calycina marina TaxID=1763456 RepID=A0A9P8CEJ9_9HELO|nr:hypothetical protein BJ878DRAFT_508884 [Calycina marina]
MVLGHPISFFIVLARTTNTRTISYTSQRCITLMLMQKRETLSTHLDEADRGNADRGNVDTGAVRTGKQQTSAHTCLGPSWWVICYYRAVGSVTFWSSPQ